MLYVCGLDCNLDRNYSQISVSNPVSHLFLGPKKLTTEKKLYMYMQDLLDRCGGGVGRGGGGA